MQSINFSSHTDAEWLAIANRKLLQSGLSEWERAVWSFLSEWYSGSVSVNVHTSGSTGKPKELQVSKQMMRVSAAKTLRFFNLQPADTALLCLSADYIAGKMMIVRAIMGDLQLFITEPSSTPLKKVNHTFTFAAMVPLQVFEQLKMPGSLNQVEKLLIGGGALSTQLTVALQDCLCEAYESYGMTETVSHIALRRINGHEGVCMGFRPMPQVSVSLDERDCVVIHSPDLLPAPLVTNDRAEFCADGSFRIVGRVDNVINSGGIKIQPEEVERQIASHFNEPFAISSVPDVKLGEKLVLVSVKNFTTEQIIAVNKLLHPYQRVHQYALVEVLPRTNSQKLDRPALRHFLLNNLFLVKPIG